jgi:hypothetical protein
MTGGLMQLVAYGAQDIYLTGNPMITYFKVVYRRHTNFAMESIEQTFNGVADFGKRVTATISRNGDLINGVYLQCDLPNLTDTNDTYWRWVDSVGHVLVQIVEVEIGGQLIDRHYGDWFEIWSQLTVPAGQVRGYKKMIGQDPLDPLDRPTGLQSLTCHCAPNPNPLRYPSQITADQNTAGSFNTPRTLYIPLQFWFCRNVGLSLPLIALQYHEVKINLTLNQINTLILGFTSPVAQATLNPGQQSDKGSEQSVAKVGVNIIATPPQSTSFPVGGSTGSLQNCSLWVDYIYLDTDERRRFAQVSHEYLIEQLQFTGTETLTGSTTNVKLNYNHPVKELVWVLQPWGGMYNQWNNYTDTPAIQLQTNENTKFTDAASFVANSSQTFSNPWGSNNPFEYVKLQLNGHDRFYQRYGTYFNQVQTRDHHTNIPESPGICVYSFALKPEDHQPSGTCNFSRIDNATLNVTLTANMLNYTKKLGVINGQPQATPALKVFAINYNVLRIMSGMGGLAYSN